MRGKEDVPLAWLVLKDVTRFRLLDDAKTNLVASRRLTSKAWCIAT